MTALIWILAAGWILLLIALVWFVHRYEQFVHEREAAARLLRMRRETEALTGIDVLGYSEDPRA